MLGVSWMLMMKGDGVAGDGDGKGEVGTLDPED